MSSPGIGDRCRPARVAIGRGLRGLDWLNFLVANFQTGFGPFVSVYLTGAGWTQGAIGAALSAGTIASMASQVPGGALVDAKRRHNALVRADGAITLGETVGSIHRIGALAQGLEACNGWAFWHVETPKGLVSIDALRAEIRAGMAAV